ncbi:hypothetical protein WN943_021622 [Citrus x changshan-huyou]
MSRRPVSSTRRLVDTGSFPFTGALQSKSRSSPLLSVGLVLVGAFLLIGYAFSGSGLYTYHGFDVYLEAIKQLLVGSKLLDVVEIMAESAVSEWVSEILFSSMPSVLLYAQRPRGHNYLPDKGL